MDYKKSNEYFWILLDYFKIVQWTVYYLFPSLKISKVLQCTYIAFRMISIKLRVKSNYPHRNSSSTDHKCTVWIPQSGTVFLLVKVFLQISKLRSWQTRATSILAFRNCSWHRHSCVAHFLSDGNISSNERLVERDGCCLNFPSWLNTGFFFHLPHLPQSEALGKETPYVTHN